MWDQETGEIGETVGGLESVLQLIITGDGGGSTKSKVAEGL